MIRIGLILVIGMLPLCANPGAAVPCQGGPNDLPECLTDYVCFGAWVTSETLLLEPLVGFGVYAGPPAPRSTARLVGVSIANAGGGPTQPGTHSSFVVIGTLTSPDGCDSRFHGLNTIAPYWVGIPPSPQPPG